MDPLCYESLSFDEKMSLGGLATHPGYVVLKKLMADACLQPTIALVKIKPDDVDYDRKIKANQLAAHITNDVCATLIKSIIMHTASGRLEGSEQRAQEELDKAVSEVRSQIGSMSIKKSRQGE